MLIFLDGEGGTFEAKEVGSDVPLVVGLGIFGGEHGSNRIFNYNCNYNL